LEIKAQIDELAAKQRELTESADEPSDAVKEQVLILQGKIAALNEVLGEALQREQEELQTLKSKAVEIGGDAKLGRVFAAMPRGEELEIRAALTEGSGSGSYLVPQEWHERVEEARFEAAVMRSAGATVIKTSSTHNVPVLTATGTAGFSAENAAYTGADPSVNPVVLGAYKLTYKTVITEELLEDSAYPVDQMLARAVGYAFGLAEDAAFMTGTGTNQPTGIFNKTADLTFAGTTAITTDELVSIPYTLGRPYRDGACWFLNDQTLLYIAKMKVPVQTSGTTPYFWTDAAGGQPPRLLGYPVYTSSAIATIGAGAKVICFGNPAFYLIGERGPLVAKRLQLQEYGDTFAFAQRIDGKPEVTGAFAVAAMHA
jgi:HK97 family phage major capsid protein